MLTTAKRRREVIRLRETGATWETIAETLLERHGEEGLPSGWDRRYAWNDFDRELAKHQEEAQESAGRVRELEVRRLDRMLAGLWKAAAGGDTDAVNSALRIQKRRAKLLGLDAAERLEVDQNVSVKAEIVQLRAVIMGALEGFPDARVAVAGALAEHAETSAQQQPDE